MQKLKRQQKKAKHDASIDKLNDEHVCHHAGALKINGRLSTDPEEWLEVAEEIVKSRFEDDTNTTKEQHDRADAKKSIYQLTNCEQSRIIKKLCKK